MVAAARIFAEIGCRVIIRESPECFLWTEEVFESRDAAKLPEMAGAEEVVNMRRNGLTNVPTIAEKLFENMHVFRNALDVDRELADYQDELPCHNHLLPEKHEGSLPPVEKWAFPQLGLDQEIADLAAIISSRTLCLLDLNAIIAGY